MERVLTELSRFTLENQIHLIIIHHPKSPKSKASDGNYECPDVFDLNDGAMWNNKIDNIIIFHKPFMQSDPDNTMCEHWSKKIRRQKIVGKKGCVCFDYLRKTRRFEFDSKDIIEEILNPIQESISFKANVNFNEPKEPESIEDIEPPF